MMADEPSSVRRDLQVNPDILFSKWRAFSGYVPEGEAVDWIGARFKTAWMAWTSFPAREIHQHPSPPLDEEFFEWIDLLESVANADDCYTMMELGAGCGRWGIRAMLAARQLGKKVRILAAEAEPQHVEWLQSAVALNDLPAEDFEIVPCVISDKRGEIFFQVSYLDYTPATWFGQSIATCSDDVLCSTDQKYFGYTVYDCNGVGHVRVEGMPLSDLLINHPVVDYIDMDIQGAEELIVRSSMNELNAKVKRVHIETHSEEIENEIRPLFIENGWINVWDFGCFRENSTPFGDVSFQGGIQGWINPRFSGEKEQILKHDRSRTPIYHFSEGRAVNGATVLGKDRVTVITTPQLWAYAFIVPLNIPRTQLDHTFCIKVAARVLEGEIGIGLTTADETAYHHEVLLPCNDSWREVDFVTPHIVDLGSFVVRNACATGRSRAQVRIIECTACPPLRPT